MARRLTPLVLAIVIASAPAALVFCAALCTEHASIMPPVNHQAHHDHGSSTPAGPTAIAVSHYSHHHSSLAQVTTDLAATSHPCPYGELPAVGAVSLTTLVAPAVLSATFVLADVPAAAARPRDIAFRAPPRPITLTAQLRI